MSRTWENVPSDMKKTQVNLNIRAVWSVFFVHMKKLCILGYRKCARWRFWSDCANAQSDQNLQWAHMSEGTFSDVGAHTYRVSRHNKLCHQTLHNVCRLLLGQQSILYYPFSGLIQQISVLFFPRISCKFHWIYAWNVKPAFWGKMWNVSICRLLKSLPSVISVNFKYTSVKKLRVFVTNGTRIYQYFSHLVSIYIDPCLKLCVCSEGAEKCFPHILYEQPITLT